MDREICDSGDEYTLFPDADDVFYSDFEKENMLPFGILKVDINGVVHNVLIASPIGDEQGLIGEKEIGERCGGEWLTYSKKNGKWAIDCSPDELLPFDYKKEEILDSYNQRRKMFYQDGTFPSKPTAEQRTVIFKRGDDESTNFHNWYISVQSYISNRLEDIPGHEEARWKRVTLVGDDGNDYIVLGSVEGYVYSAPFTAQILFFYNPAAERVLVIFNYT